MFTILEPGKASEKSSKRREGKYRIYLCLCEGTKALTVEEKAANSVTLDENIKQMEER
jgi:hypothetical protein